MKNVFSLNKTKDHFINILKLLPRAKADMNLPRFCLCFGCFVVDFLFVCLVWFWFVVGVFCNYCCAFFFSSWLVHPLKKKSLKISYACKTSLPEQSCLHYCDVYRGKVLWHFIKPRSRSSSVLASTCKVHQDQAVVLVLQESPFTLTFTFGCSFTMSSVAELWRQPAGTGQRQV